MRYDQIICINQPLKSKNENVRHFITVKILFGFIYCILNKKWFDEQRQFLYIFVWRFYKLTDLKFYIEKSFFNSQFINANNGII